MSIMKQSGVYSHLRYTINIHYYTVKYKYEQQNQEERSLLAAYAKQAVRYLFGVTHMMIVPIIHQHAAQNRSWATHKPATRSKFRKKAKKIEREKQKWKIKRQ